MKGWVWHGSRGGAHVGPGIWAWWRGWLCTMTLIHNIQQVCALCCATLLLCHLCSRHQDLLRQHSTDSGPAACGPQLECHAVHPSTLVRRSTALLQTASPLRLSNDRQGPSGVHVSMQRMWEQAQQWCILLHLSRSRSSSRSVCLCSLLCQVCWQSQDKPYHGLCCHQML